MDLSQSRMNPVFIRFSVKLMFLPTFFHISDISMIHSASFNESQSTCFNQCFSFCVPNIVCSSLSTVFDAPSIWMTVVNIYVSPHDSPQFHCSARNSDYERCQNQKCPESFLMADRCNKWNQNRGERVRSEKYSSKQQRRSVWLVVCAVFSPPDRISGRGMHAMGRERFHLSPVMFRHNILSFPFMNFPWAQVS